MHPPPTPDSERIAVESPIAFSARVEADVTLGTRAAAVLFDLANAQIIPAEEATEEVLGAYAGFDGGIFGATWRRCGLTAGRLAFTAISGARFAILIGVAIAIPTDGTSAAVLRTFFAVFYIGIA